MANVNKHATQDWVNEELDKKANKYELCLERNYIDIKINGDAKFNGEVCGTYNPETDELIYGVGAAWREGDINSDGVDYWNYIEWESENDYLELPIEPITIKRGLYYISVFSICGGALLPHGKDYALYRYNEDGEIDTFSLGFIVEIGGYNLETANSPQFHLCDISEDITVSSVKIKAKTPGMRMAENTFEGVTDGYWGSSGRLISTSEILEYIDWKDQSNLKYTVNEAKRLIEEKADKSDIERLEKDLQEVKAALDSLIGGEST